LTLARKLDRDGILGNGIVYERGLIERERAVVDDSLSALAQRLIIYACQRCGRPIEYISIPCVFCGWHPTTLDEMARSARLSRYYFSTWELLGIGRGIAVGRKATDVVINLAESAAEHMANPRADFGKGVESVLNDAEQKQKDNYFSWHQAATCERCGTFNFLYDVRECSECGDPLQLPPPFEITNLSFSTHNTLNRYDRCALGLGAGDRSRHRIGLAWSSDRIAVLLRWLRLSVCYAGYYGGYGCPYGYGALLEQLKG
jgi:ribosomal protein L37E